MFSGCSFDTFPGFAPARYRLKSGGGGGFNESVSGKNPLNFSYNDFFVPDLELHGHMIKTVIILNSQRIFGQSKLYFSRVAFKNLVKKRRMLLLRTRPPRPNITKK